MPTDPGDLQSCQGCGLVTAVEDGPTHPYIGASPGCWARYGEFIAGGIGGQLAVDTYAVQHPGVEERRSSQSVSVHLISICAVLERGHAQADSIDLLRRAIASRERWPWLPLSAPIGTITIADVLARTVAVPEWASDIWNAWSPHHFTVREWLDGLWS